MVGEIVVHRNAARGAAQFHAALHTPESGERGAGCVGEHPGVVRRGDGRQGVAAVVRPGLVPVHRAHALAAQQHVEALLAALRGPALRIIEARHLAPVAARQHALQSPGAGIDHELAAARHGAHQVVELGLDRGQIGEDVGVVVFEVVQHCGARTIVDELGALVEKRGVVLIGLDDKKIGTQPCGCTEIERHAADQEAGVHSGLVEDVRQHRGGRGLAVRTGDRQRPAPAQHMLGQPLRPAHIRLPGVEYGFHQRIAARHHIADHPQVGLECELIGAVAFDQLDAESFELGAHRRIDLRVAAGDAMPRLFGQRGDSAHEGAANPEDVNMHDGGGF
ncbi:hypothetical protein GALL_445910 [mine drainage metagenome]|uniref:Uncharacterized protein n=1 Tax=mine drainage metagenome TaxID=410659 RepID=A0A1J5Q8F3_9ZZZZ